MTLRERNLAKMRQSYQDHLAEIAAMSPEDRAEYEREKARRQEAIAEIFRIDDEAGLV